MLAREILRYYRKEKGLSQKELCKGICSKSHLSRIESGKVTLSSEILALLTKRLGINLNEKLNSYHLIENYLNELNNALIMQNSKKVDEIIIKLNQIPFITSSKYVAKYLLILSRYYIWRNQLKQAIKTINSVERKYSSHLNEYEKNFLLHVKAIYYLSIYRTSTNVDMLDVVRSLTLIDLEIYINKEVYYHLALAYHYIGVNLLVYINAKKALNYFNETSNYVHAINAQTLLLILEDKVEENHFENIVERYENLILNCESIGANIQKGILLNNLGVKFFTREEYVYASHYFKQSLLLTDKTSIYYLRRLYNYTESCLEGCLLLKTEILELINEGIKLAEKNKSTIHITLFNLLKLNCENKENQYYEYLAEVAIPQFKLTNNKSHYNQYGKRLFKHYFDKGLYKEAVELQKQFSIYI